jgi:prepilin-type N-terminal cleavage/methylation domain-containing protein
MPHASRLTQKYSVNKAFTLTELLVALAVLGLITSFIIPKVISDINSRGYNTSLKQCMATITNEYQTYIASTIPNANTSSNMILKNLNYIEIDTTSTITGLYGTTVRSYQCTPSGYAPGTGICYKLHSGGVLMAYAQQETFGGTTPNNVIPYLFDPDGNGSTTGVIIFLYFNGRVVTYSKLLSNSPSALWNYNPLPDPSWVRL